MFIWLRILSKNFKEIGVYYKMLRKYYDQKTVASEYRIFWVLNSAVQKLYLKNIFKLFLSKSKTLICVKINEVFIYSR